LNVEQQYFLNKLEEAVAKLTFNGKFEEAEGVAKVVEYLQNDESVMAYLEGEASGVNPAVLNALKKLFGIRY
jgi:hypothetical protein